MTDGSYDENGRCTICHQYHPCNCESQFMGSRAEGEDAMEHAAREAQWREDHACTKCGEFGCDGKCDEFNQEIEADASLLGKDWSHDDLNYAAMKESEDE